MRTGFNISRASDQGLCGKGVYFCTHPSSSFQKSHGRYAATSAAAIGISSCEFVQAATTKAAAAGIPAPALEFPLRSAYAE